MNLCEEYAALSRHLMLFLVAVFAFSVQAIQASPGTGPRSLFIVSLALALLSFATGYATLFRLFRDERKNPTADRASCTPSSAVTWRLNLQYLLTVVALTLCSAALVWTFW